MVCGHIQFMGASLKPWVHLPANDRPQTVNPSKLQVLHLQNGDNHTYFEELLEETRKRKGMDRKVSLVHGRHLIKHVPFTSPFVMAKPALVMK